MATLAYCCLVVVPLPVLSELVAPTLLGALPTVELPVAGAPALPTAPVLLLSFIVPLLVAEPDDEPEDMPDEVVPDDELPLMSLPLVPVELHAASDRAIKPPRIAPWYFFMMFSCEVVESIMDQKAGVQNRMGPFR